MLTSLAPVGYAPHGQLVWFATPTGVMIEFCLHHNNWWPLNGVSSGPLEFSVSSIVIELKLEPELELGRRLDEDGITKAWSLEEGRGGQARGGQRRIFQASSHEPHSEATLG